MMTGDTTLRIGVDVGGTFTDLVVVDAAGALTAFKSPSIPADPEAGVLAAVDLAAAGLGLSRRDLLRRCAGFVHGTTIATNTMLESKGARVGLLTTEGFRDWLEIRRGVRAESLGPSLRPSREVLVPRHLRLPVAERIDQDGTELRPLDPADVRAAAATLRRGRCRVRRGLPAARLPQPGARGSGRRPCWRSCCQACRSRSPAPSRR